MNLSDITVMILTHNERDNLRQTLEGLSWAPHILIVDSFSTDETLTIAAEFLSARVVQRTFDHFADQCNFGLEQITTPWVLSIDADYRCDQSFAEEIENLHLAHDSYEASFRYIVFGRPLRGTLYPPRVVLYRRDHGRYTRDGHAHRVVIDGSVGKLRSPILHDDWKPLSSWLSSQSRYASLEANKLMSFEAKDLNWKDRIRKKILFAPLLTLLYCLFAKGLIVDGWRGLYYALQRTYAELVLSLVLLDRQLRPPSAGTGSESSQADVLE